MARTKQILWYILDNLLRFSERYRWPVRIGVGVLMLAMVSTFLLLKTAMAIFPGLVRTDLPVDKPLTITLNQALRGIDLDDITIEPSIDGEWSFEPGGLLGGGDELVFRHPQDFAINTKYTIKFGEVQRFLLGDSNLPMVSFETQNAPDLMEKKLAKLKDGDEIAADYIFEAHLQFANQNLRNLQIRTEPTIEFKNSIYEDRYYMWWPVGLLPQGQNIKVEIWDGKNQELLLSRMLKIADEPSIKTMVRADHFGQNEEARIEFNQVISSKTRSQIAFDLEGEGRWESDTVYVFKPDKVEPGKTYTYHVKAGLRSESGGVLAHDIDGSFATIGAVVVTDSSPRGKELSQGQQTIKFTFDQAVDHQSAEQHFAISHGTVAGFSWSGNTMSATVKNLGFQQTVTAAMTAGVTNAEFGLPSQQAFSTSFTTEIRTIKLAVPMLRQERGTTCVAASIRMALAYHGVGAGEMDIVYRMGYNPRPMDTATNTWDDPAEMFVGYLDGTSVYTVNGAEVVIAAKVVGSYGRGSTSRTGDGVNIWWIAQEIHNGHPVVISGTGLRGKTTYYSYTAPNGRTVKSASNGHARVVTGVRGEPGAPLTFYINDPANGTLTWSASQLANNLRTNAYGGQAVAIY